MKQTTLAAWLRAILLGMGICGLGVYAGAVPMLGESLVAEYPEFRRCYLPWLGLIWATALPCFLALGCGWRIAGNIGLDRSFTVTNARLLRWISVLAAWDAAVFFGGNLIYLLLDLNHPGIVLFSLLVSFAGVAIAVAFAALSQLVRRAAVLQDQSDLTI